MTANDPKRTNTQAVALLAIGSFLGYLAATVDWPQTASASPAGTAVIGETSCSPSELNRGTLLALASHNEVVAENAAQTGKKPNILVIFGDDIGQSNVSAYTMGLMGYRTPNIDRIAKEGMILTDYYAEQSCTAGRSTFLTGQCTLRTGLSKVGMPASPIGFQERRCDARRAPEATRLRHWSIRQESCWRPQ